MRMTIYICRIIIIIIDIVATTIVHRLLALRADCAALISTDRLSLTVDV